MIPQPILTDLSHSIDRLELCAPVLVADDAALVIAQELERLKAILGVLRALSRPNDNLLAVQFDLSYDTADRELSHIEYSLDSAHPQRAELNALRRNLAGTMFRLGRSAESCQPDE